MPAVSVVVPTYNRPEFLPEAIASVLNQTFQDFEVIVVDDASSIGDAADIIRGFEDKRLKFIRHGVNRGLAAARNTGVRASLGKYIAFLDDDDEWLSQKLTIQVDLLEKSPKRVGVIYTGCFLVDSSTGKIIDRKVPIKRGDIFHALVEDDCVVSGGSTTLIRRECFENTGFFDEAIPAWEAYDMWIRLSKDFEFDYVKEPLVKVHIHGNKIGNDYNMLINGIERMVEKHGCAFSLNPRGYSDHYFKLGMIYSLNGDVREGRRKIMRAIRIYPRKVKYYVYLALSVLGLTVVKAFLTMKNKMVGRPTYLSPR